MADNRIHEISIFALDLAMRAGEIVEQERRKNAFERNYKSQHELVTSADIKVDEFINKTIRKTYPDHRILSEEVSPQVLQDESLDTPLWIIDPIDGTVNFAHGHPQVAVSIAYAEKGEVQLGVVHCPFLHETFHAIKGENASVNHKHIQVSQITEIRDALIATGFPYDKSSTDLLTARVNRVLHSCQDIRRNGSAAIDICWVACGRLDGYYESLSPWDFAAARLIATEAGATAGHFSEIPESAHAALYGKDIIIANPAIYDSLRKIIADDPA
jgi:myo-inositol-1(or 4)-monophosphatase